MLLLVINDLETYKQLITRYLTLDTGLRRIKEANSKKRSIRTEGKSTTFTSTTTTPGTTRLVTSSSYSRTSVTPERNIRLST